jgi:dTDP-4-dehydrorhamnose 3,5-epimerase
MILEATSLAGVLMVRPGPHADNRGLFARTYCRETFASAGVDFTPLQMSTSFNRVAGTLRGLHWQEAPHGEAKLVRVTRGAMFDVAVDLRPASRTYKQWFGLEITAENRLSLLIPRGFAHGFVTFEDETEVAYAIDTPYAPAAARGARFDEPAFNIEWPVAPSVVGERDLAWPAFES